MTDLPRTPDQIKTRIAAISNVDLFGAQTGNLVAALPFDDAQPWLKPEVPAAEWVPTLTAEQVRTAAVKYLDFAMGKADDHRSLSANRSIDHYRGWLWLLGLDEKVDWDDYAQYGAPILRQAATLLGAEQEWQQHSTAALERMATGQPCTPDCIEGCAG